MTAQQQKQQQQEQDTKYMKNTNENSHKSKLFKKIFFIHPKTYHHRQSPPTNY